MTGLELRDHIKDVLICIAEDLEKSPEDRRDGPAEVHADTRWEHGYSLKQLITEYWALRKTVIQLWVEEESDSHLVDTIYFNDNIDYAATHSISRYAARLEWSKQLMMGILGHDIRDPLNAIGVVARND